jgi:hypothetical protein
MANTEASEAARLLVRQRWGNRGAVRAAAVVVERADELPEEVRAAVHEATSQDTEAAQ